MANCKYCGNTTRGNNQYICGNCRKIRRAYSRKKGIVKLKNLVFEKLVEYVLFLKRNNAPPGYEQALRKLFKPLYKRRK
jgi:hypothetical protein